MGTLTSKEKARLEKLFDMASGYVCNFSNNTIDTFFAEFDVDIHSTKYQGSGTSKANKVREFWRIEDDYLVGKVIKALVEHVEEYPLHSFELTDAKKALIDPCKEVAARLMSGQANLNHLKTVALVFDAKHLAEQIRRIESSVNEDPALAIGTAKELIETCCKTIMSERGKPITGTPDIPTLTKTTLKELDLIPEGVSEKSRGSDTIKRILQNLGAIGNGIAELRGLYGTGHGKDGKAVGLTARHAKLAVGAAATLVTFLFDTHQASKK